jgi:cyclopropane-fatty-acyl-phospholipid synthase
MRSTQPHRRIVGDGPGTAPPATSGASREAIEHHYDVGRDFYRLWLDTNMIYSCALWPGEPDDDLDAAQVAKLSWHATGAGADGARRVLDVGCGWGGMLRYLREERGVGHVTGLTLSADQAEVARAAVPDADVRLEDWRDHRPDSAYDAVISIGALEHFARLDLTQEERRAVYRRFFARCSGWLRPGGRLSLQTIAFEDFDPTSAPVSSFFAEEVFPESMLPRLGELVDSFEGGFRLVALRSDADQYSHTLRLWQQRLEQRRTEADALVGRETARHYLRYLRLSRAMFDRRVCTLYRLVLERRPEAA